MATSATPPTAARYTISATSHGRNRALTSRASGRSKWRASIQPPILRLRVAQGRTIDRPAPDLLIIDIVIRYREDAVIEMQTPVGEPAHEIDVMRGD